MLKGFIYLICCLDSKFIRVPCQQKSFVFFFVLLLAQDTHETYTKMRVIDLCWLYSCHMQNTQRTYLNDCWHILCSSWIWIIETWLKLICALFFSTVAKEMKQSFDDLWAVDFVFWVVCVHEYVCVYLCLFVCVCVCVFH